MTIAAPQAAFHLAIRFPSVACNPLDCSMDLPNPAAMLKKKQPQPAYGAGSAYPGVLGPGLETHHSTVNRPDGGLTNSIRHPHIQSPALPRRWPCELSKTLCRRPRERLLAAGIYPWHAPGACLAVTPISHPNGTACLIADQFGTFGVGSRRYYGRSTIRASPARPACPD